jgi:hypothetical protein
MNFFDIIDDLVEPRLFVPLSNDKVGGYSCDGESHWSAEETGLSNTLLTGPLFSASLQPTSTQYFTISPCQLVAALFLGRIT